MQFLLIPKNIKMKTAKYIFAILILLMSTSFFGLRMFYIGTSVWSLITSIVIIVLLTYIFLKKRDYIHRESFMLCLFILICSLIVNTYTCFRLDAPFITVIKSMKFIVPGPFMCFVLHYIYNKKDDSLIITRSLMFLMFIYLLLQFFASVTHSYNSLFYDDFNSVRYGNERQRIMSPGTEIYLCMVCFFYLTDIWKHQRKQSKMYTAEKYAYFLLYAFFIVFIYVSKSYLLAVLIPLSVFIVRKSTVNYAKLVIALFSIVLVFFVVDYLSNGKISSTATSYYDDFFTDSHSSAEPRKKALSEYYDLFKETNLIGIGHAAVHYDRRIEYLIEVEGVKYVDIGIVGVFYQYGILMVVLSIWFVLYFTRVFLRARNVNDLFAKQIASSVLYTLLFIAIGLIPLWLHEFRAYACGVILYYVMIIEDEIKREKHLVGWPS